MIRPAAILLVLGAALGGRPALAQTLAPGEATLYGRVLDGPTGIPIAGAVVRVGDAMARTDATGHYELDFTAGRFALEVHAHLPGGWDEHLAQPDQWADPGSAAERVIYLVTGAYLDDHPVLPDGIGVPIERPSAEPEPTEPIDLLELVWRRNHPNGPTLEDLQHLELPDVLPSTIRVLRAYGRRTGCSGTGDYPITEVDLDTYAAGVVTAEIGVFRALTTGEDSQLEGFKTFAIAARAYALWFWAQNPDAAWHIDDTACNQRYTDGPYPAIIEQAAQATSGMFLVKAGTTATIDKFEYAASCGRCGTLPEYQDTVVEDDTGVVACTSGGWCGHDSCGGHQDNPSCPLEGPDVNCLVRGICQWGTAERSARGDAYDEILAHYQPNLDIAQANPPAPARLLGYVRAGSVETGVAVPGAQVALDTGETATTGADGLFVIDDATPGTRYLSVRADGYQPVDEYVEVAPAVDTWHDVALTPASPSEGEADADAAEPVADGGGPGGDVDAPDSPAEDASGGDETTGGSGPTGPPGFEFGRFGVVPAQGLPSGCGCAIGGRHSPQLLLFVLIWGLGRRARRRAASGP